MLARWKITILSCLLLLLPALVPLEAAEQASADAVLELAISAGNWLIDQGIPQETGTAWPANANKPDQISYDLGSGVAGHVAYLVALYRATGEDRFLKQATEGAHYLAWLLEDESRLDGGSRRASLYTGIAGIGVALQIIREHAPEFDASVQRVIDILADWSVEERTGIRWSDDFNDLLYGDAGTILFLAYEAARDGDRQARELAVKGSLLLASRAQPASGGHYWLFRRSKPFNLPGLSHGTAGITYVLATVGAMTDDETLLDAATAGFTYLQSIATVEDELVRMPYGWPLENWAGLFEFGWAHGLVGYAALMTRLQQLEVETAAAARYNALFVNTLAHIGLPADPLPPFSEPSTPLDMRFGRAGVLALISDHGTRLQLRDALWEQIEQRAIRKSGTAYWEVDAPEFMGGGTATFTGILHGAAGIGLALLHLHAALLDERPHVSLPDDPKAWTDPNKSRVFPGN